MAIVGTMREAVTEGVATKEDPQTGFASSESCRTVRFYGGSLAVVAAVVALVMLLPQATRSRRCFVGA